MKASLIPIAFLLILSARALKIRNSHQKNFSTSYSYSSQSVNGQPAQYSYSYDDGSGNVQSGNQLSEDQFNQLPFKNQFGFGDNDFSSFSNFPNFQDEMSDHSFPQNFNNDYYQNNQEYSDGQNEQTEQSSPNDYQYQDGNNNNQENQNRASSNGANDQGSISDKAQVQLEKHNQYRRKHHAPDLKLSSQLTKRAQQYAQQLVALGTLKHSNCTLDNGKRIGENLFGMSGYQVRGGQATDAWYAQVQNYDYSSGSFSMQTGHFTQVVWVGSKQVGFGYSDGYVVANYYPAGNMMGDFQKNVLPQ